MKTYQFFTRLFAILGLVTFFSISTVFSQIANPSLLYELYYDDGSAEDFAAWIEPGGQVAVMFAPYTYPYKVTGGRLYVGDGFFPEGGYWLGTDVVICLFDDDGTDDMPGTLIDSVRVTVNNYGWLVFDSIFDHDFFEGNFYIGMMQIGTAPDVAPIGIDTDNPVWGYSYAIQAGSEWFLSPYQDYMIRAFVDNATGGKELLTNENINIYPNPATNTVNISSEKEISKIEVFNQVGQKVAMFENVNSRSYKLDVSGLKSDTYFMRLTSEELTTTKKIIIVPK